MTNLLNRRALVRAFPFIGAVAFAPVIMAQAAKAEPKEADYIAVPKEAWAAVEAWALAHRNAGAGAKHYSDFLRPIGLRRVSGGASVSPAERAEADRFFAEMVSASEGVGPARERMIVALLKATRST